MSRLYLECLPCPFGISRVRLLNSLTFNAGIKSLLATVPGEIFTWKFASWTMIFINICVKNQQIQQLFIQFINYVSYMFWHYIAILSEHS
jgi:hypothetical protein